MTGVPDRRVEYKAIVLAAALLGSVVAGDEPGRILKLCALPDGYVVLLKDSAGDLFVRRNVAAHARDGTGGTRSFLRKIPSSVGPSDSFPRAFSDDCSRLAIGNSDGSIELWSGERDITPFIREGKGNLHNVVRGPEVAVTALAFSPNNRLLASGYESGHVAIWRTSDGAVLGAAVKVHERAVESIAFQPPHGEVIVSSSGGGRQISVRVLGDFGIE